jgi:hypothetical protein
MHVKFAAIVDHDARDASNTSSTNPDEIAMDLEDDVETSDDKLLSATCPLQKVTYFLALDKCRPGGDFLQVIKIASELDDFLRDDKLI